MKRVAVLLLAFVLLFSVTAISESSKYASLSLEELVKERNEIEAEISKRVGAESVIHSGKYTVGKHIKAGTYTLTCLETHGNYCQVGKYEGKEFDGVYLDVGESTTVFLEESPDMVISLTISDGTFSITAVTPSWAP